MDINFQTITIETFDADLNGLVKAKLKFKKEQTLADKDGSRLGNHLRAFVVEKIKNGTLPFSEEKTMLFAMVKDKKHAEISSLTKPESIQ